MRKIRAIQKGLSVFCALALTLTMTQIGGGLAAEAASELSVVLGNSTFSSPDYYYSNATVTGSGIRTILISFSENVASGDKIDLPTTTPSGFTVSTQRSSSSSALLFLRRE